MFLFFKVYRLRSGLTSRSVIGFAGFPTCFVFLVKKTWVTDHFSSVTFNVRVTAPRPSGRSTFIRITYTPLASPEKFREIVCLPALNAWLGFVNTSS
jgi:hypothetical protein